MYLPRDVGTRGHRSLLDVGDREQRCSLLVAQSHMVGEVRRRELCLSPQQVGGDLVVAPETRKPIDLDHPPTYRVTARTPPSTRQTTAELEPPHRPWLADREPTRPDRRPYPGSDLRVDAVLVRSGVAQRARPSHALALGTPLLSLLARRPKTLAVAVVPGSKRPLVRDTSRAAWIRIALGPSRSTMPARDQALPLVAQNRCTISVPPDKADPRVAV